MEQMQFSRSNNGYVKVTRDQKQKILEYLEQGHGIAEVARFYGLRILLLSKWKRQAVKSLMNNQSPDSCTVTDAMVPVSEYKKLYEENQKLRKALGNVSYDRDILQEAVNIASKKKWI